MREIISLSLPEKILRRMDEIRGDVPRSRFVLRALERVMSKSYHKRRGQAMQRAKHSIALRPQRATQRDQVPSNG